MLLIKNVEMSRLCYLVGPDIIIMVHRRKMQIVQDQSRSRDWNNVL